MALKFYEILIAVFVGLIPILIQLFFNFRTYKKSQTDKYGSFLYEKQYEVYLELFKQIEELNKKAQEVFINLKNGWYSETINELTGRSIENSFNADLEDIKDYIKHNSIILPNNFLKELYDFIRINNLIRNHIIVNTTKKENILNSNLKSLSEYGDLKTFHTMYHNQFLEILRYIKTLVGTEFLSKETIDYIKKNKGKGRFIYFADRQANME